MIGRLPVILAGFLQVFAAVAVQKKGFPARMGHRKKHAQNLRNGGADPQNPPVVHRTTRSSTYPTLN